MCAQVPLQSLKEREDVSNYAQQEEKCPIEKIWSFKKLNTVSKFKSLIKEATYFICIICKKSFYKRSFSEFLGVVY